MASRVGGVLALVAAACLGVALLLPWWHGHPTVDGNDVRMLDVDIGLFGGERCNTGGDGTCTKLPLVGGFKTLEAIEIGAAAAAILVAAAVAAAALARSRRRKLAGRIGMVAGGAAAMVTLLLLVTGPDIHVSQTVAVPTSLGGFVALVGAIAAIAGSVLARRDDAARRPVVVAAAPIVRAPPMMAPAMAPPPAEPYAARLDVHAVLADDAPRPARVAAEPKLAAPLPPSTSGNLPGPAGPLVPPSAAQPPLFSAAPQLRPLYEMPGSSFVPPPPPPLPTRAPTPIVRSAFEDDDSVVAPPPPPSRPAPRRTAPPSPRPPTTLPSPPRPPKPSGLVATGAAAPALPPRVPPQPIITSPRPPIAEVPTPPPLGLPTPPSFPPASASSADMPSLSGSTPALSRSDLITAETEDDAEPSQEPSQDSFDGRATVSRDPDPPPTDPDAAAEQTSPGMSAALDETPAAELLSPDDIETRGLRKLSARELEELGSRDSSSSLTTPMPVFAERSDRAQPAQRPSDPVVTSAKRPPPVATPTPRVDQSSAPLRGAAHAGEAGAFDTPRVDAPRIDTEADPSVDDPPEPTGDGDELTDDRAPVPGALSSPPRIPTPPPPLDPSAMDVGHAPTPVAATPFVAPPISVAVAAALPSLVPAAKPVITPLQPPPPRAIKTPPPNSGPQPACPQCEAPMVWVEEHLRFYCRSCKMYF